MPSRSSSPSSKICSFGAQDLIPIPGPTALPIVGNIFDIDMEIPTQSIMKMAEDYRPIFKVSFGGEDQIFVASVELLNEISDETRFRKVVTGGLMKLRSGANDGLFTAHDGEKNWEIAHRLLVPVFGPTKIRDMYPPMKEIADQLCLKWARFGPKYPVDPAGDFTRLTLDTIALCGMGFRFNSFYRDSGFHPFVDSMNRWLKDADKQASRPEFVNNLRILAMKKFEADIKMMRDICQDIADQRRKQPVEANDLLNSLLYSKDPNSGEGLNDESIIDNMITFLVAGHETTSGLLSFVFYYLLKNPEAYAKARQEVDDVVGAQKITVGHLSQLKYISALMRETLRLMPTAPAFTVGAKEDTVIGGKYKVNKDVPIFGLLPSVHRDPDVYGPDAAEWKPERMLDDSFNKFPPGSWKPFGNGKRGCIGRAFAWQEALLVIALVLQTFDLELDDPDYELKIRESLTLKPDGFFMHASLRRHKSANELVSGLSAAIESKNGEKTPTSQERTPDSGKPISIFYGTNSGTCESLAHRLAGNAAQRGFAARHVEPLDSATNNLPTGHPVIILTSSYDGNPPENAARFVKWLEAVEPKSMSDVSYAVFGCGHHDWATTFYKIPIVVDEALERHGAKRLAARGAVDTADDDAFLGLEEWEEQTLWPALGAVPGVPDSSRLKITYQAPYNTRKGFVEALVSDIRLLSEPGVAKKGHIELMLPQGMTYSTGDSLAVLPLNSRSTVQRVLSRFHLPWDSMIRIEGSEQGNLPSEPISVADLFSSYVELSQPATPRNIRTLADASSDETKQTLLILAADTYTSKIRDKRVSVLELLERFPSIKLSVEEFLEMLPALRHRLYSISSSPDWNANHATLTWSVVDAPAYSGAGRFLGVASNHFLKLTPGAVLRISLRTTNPAFRPPTDPAATPAIMIASGSGLAPFRGFVQDRATQLRAGKALAPALLFFGCRGPQDDLYRAELDGFEDEGIVQVRRAYSQAQSHPDSDGCGYVQDRLLKDRKAFLDLWDRGALVYVCGGTRMAEAVKAAFTRITYDAQDHPVATDPKAWFSGLEPKRYVAEVFT